ncbi:Biopolymer transport, TolR [Candidatus Magnetoovum chiemensis]|nr:Biopolymer transport, TolR [Candidatus Magnetoovum chiemensis]
MKVSKEKSTMSEINVTPFVDVMLVLLIIFMVTAPMMKQGLDIDLPKTKGDALERQERYTITINKGGELFLNTKEVTKEELVSKMASISKINPDVYIEADKDVPYGTAIDVMSEIKASGIEKIGIITEPKTSNE